MVYRQPMTSLIVFPVSEFDKNELKQFLLRVVLTYAASRAVFFLEEQFAKEHQLIRLLSSFQRLINFNFPLLRHFKLMKTL
jgi:hypothetical protein